MIDVTEQVNDGVPRTLLNVADIAKRYGGVQALQNVSFDVRAGEVHCLMGANGSGKSTLIKIICGVETPDQGTIRMGEKAWERLSPIEAVRAGIQVIPQDLALLPNLSVAENIAMSALIAQGRRIFSPAEARRLAVPAMERVGVELPLSAPVRALSVADRQITAICRALAQQAKIVFMDEPTTALTRNEVRALVSVIRRLNEAGVGVVFVSHKLEEVLEISDRVTVLRNGKLVAAGPAAEFDRQRLVETMMGQAIVGDERRTVEPKDDRVVLKVEGLSRKDAFEDFSISLKAGEVVGIVGLLGSGRTEIAEAIFGLEPATSGRIEVNGKAVRIASVGDALRHGIAYVPEDRLTEGLFLEQSLSDNLVSASLDLVAKTGGWLNPSGKRQTASELVERLAIKIGSLDDPATSLSGGNQQRIVLGKWLLRNPKVLILNGPTVGVDVDSKTQILELLRKLAAQEQTAIIIISDDLTEMEAICGRVLVLRRGRVGAEIVGDDVTEQRLYKELVA